MSLETGEVTVTLTYKGEKPFNDSECLVIFNTVVRKIFHALNLAYLPRGLDKAYYDPVNKAVLPKHKLEIWPGYVVAMDEYEGGFKVMIDSSSRVMRTETVLDVLTESYKKGAASFKENAIRSLVGSSCITR